MKLTGRTKGMPGADAFSTKARFMWTRLAYHLIGVNTPMSQFGDHSSVLLTISRGAGKQIAIDLSSLTLPELLAFRETVLIATEVAEPIVTALDKRAREEMENGLDSDPRCYRPLPTVVVRKGALREYDERLLHGRSDVLSGVQLNVLQGGGPSGSSGNVDEQREDISESSEDNS